MKRKEPFSTEQQIQQYAALIIAFILAFAGCINLLSADDTDLRLTFGMIILASIFLLIWLGQKESNS